MNRTDDPKKQPVPFGVNGPREDIGPTTPTGDNSASYNSGFPPITMLLKAAGGLPPKGQDMNQILYELSSLSRWNSAGALNVYDSTFGAAISGYPKGAVLSNSTFTGSWLNTTDGNTANPENTNASLTGWVPAFTYGTTDVTGLAAANVTLTALQAANERITLAGILTANINLVFPAWSKSWTIVNNCTGAFSVTCKTPSGTGIAVAAGSTVRIIGNGTNIISNESPLIAGALQKSANLSDLQSTSTARTNLGLGGAAVLNVGTTSGTVAAGNDPRITASLLKANNLSDLTNVAEALLNLGLGDAAKLGVATDAEVIAGLVGKAITAATLKSRFASVVLYPSGTEAVPPTLTAGQRIVIDNPFPGRPVSAEVEVFANGIWDSPNIMVAPQGNGGPSAGAKAKYLFDSDKIVIQTAVNGVLYLSVYSGSAHNFLSGGDVFSGTIFSARQYRLRVRTL
ncbi:TPA: hypothetical protein RFB65_001874 [Yersinia enterocolitica]|nr:hypothetical protein [Yersinia enterocolitica]HDW8054804.1 hypothetical protein [Yersinia enterocolitica]HEF7251598.1 hypothetical protein [Yersinia enterocolitica]